MYLSSCSALGAVQALKHRTKLTADHFLPRNTLTIPLTRLAVTCDKPGEACQGLYANPLVIVFTGKHPDLQAQDLKAYQFNGLSIERPAQRICASLVRSSCFLGDLSRRFRWYHIFVERI
jgi:hypothetical protein